MKFKRKVSEMLSTEKCIKQNDRQLRDIISEEKYQEKIYERAQKKQKRIKRAKIQVGQKKKTLQHKEKTLKLRNESLSEQIKQSIRKKNIKELKSKKTRLENKKTNLDPIKDAAHLCKLDTKLKMVTLNLEIYEDSNDNNRKTDDNDYNNNVPVNKETVNDATANAKPKSQTWEVRHVGLTPHRFHLYVAVDDATVDDATVVDATVNDATVDNATVDDATVDDATVDDAAVDVAVDNATVDDAIVDDAAVDVAVDNDADDTSATNDACNAIDKSGIEDKKDEEEEEDEDENNYSSDNSDSSDSSDFDYEPAWKKHNKHSTSNNGKKIKVDHDGQMRTLLASVYKNTVHKNNDHLGTSMKNNCVTSRMKKFEKGDIFLQIQYTEVKNQKITQKINCVAALAKATGNISKHPQSIYKGWNPANIDKYTNYEVEYITKKHSITPDKFGHYLNQHGIHNKHREKFFKYLLKLEQQGHPNGM